MLRKMDTLSDKGIRHYYLFIFLVNPAMHWYSVLLILNFVKYLSSNLKTHSIIGFFENITSF
jgi:hypothetical protein